MRVIGNLQIFGENSKIRLNQDIQDNLQYSGFVMEDIVGEQVTAGQALYYDMASQRWKLAKADDANRMPCRGLAVQNINSGEAGLILKFGTFRFNSWSFSKNSLYVSQTRAGLITDDIPTGPGSIVQIIGSPLKSNIGQFDFCPTMNTLT